jgi:hypothetical protein
LRAHNYIGDLTIFSRSLLEKIGGFRDGFDAHPHYDLILRASEQAGAIVHVQHVLYHRRTTLAQGSAPEAARRAAERKALQEHCTRQDIAGEVADGFERGTYRLISSSPVRPLPARVTDTLKVVHSGNVGDLIWHLPSVVWLAKHYELSKARLYLRTNVPAPYMPGLNHPCGDVLLTKSFAESVIPLLKQQDYLEDVSIWRGEEVDVDLDVFRRTGFPLGRGDIGKWLCHAIPCCPKLWEPWLTVPGAEPNGLILVNRTLRSHNSVINYRFLEQYSNVHFVGLRAEYEAFRKDVDIPWKETPTFLDLARLIAGCRLFVGNQSVAYVLAQALLVPRIVELWPLSPNNFAHGPKGFEAWSQPVLEEGVKILFEDTSSA